MSADRRLGDGGFGRWSLVLHSCSGRRPLRLYRAIVQSLMEDCEMPLVWVLLAMFRDTTAVCAHYGDAIALPHAVNWARRVGQIAQQYHGDHVTFQAG